jgi:3-oxoacyl-[acyl-carrier protein] reductase
MPKQAHEPVGVDGKVAIILGATRGIGRATAALLAAGGARVVVAGRTLAACEEVAQQISARGGAAIAAIVDVAEYDTVAQAAQRVAALYGRIDILVNNAGVIDPIARLGECDPAAWQASIAINLVGAFNGIRATLPFFVEQGEGIIVNVSSGAASNFREGWSAYCAGKAGLAMLTQALHHEYATSGIVTFGFRPGLVDTVMQERIRASGINEISRLDRSVLAPPEEPARVIAWLCSPAAKALSGRELDIRDPDLRALAGLPIKVTAAAPPATAGRH